MENDRTTPKYPNLHYPLYDSPRPIRVPFNSPIVVFHNPPPHTRSINHRRTNRLRIARPHTTPSTDQPPRSPQLHSPLLSRRQNLSRRVEITNTTLRDRNMDLNHDHRIFRSPAPPRNPIPTKLPPQSPPIQKYSYCKEELRGYLSFHVSNCRKHPRFLHVSSLHQ